MLEDLGWAWIIAPLAVFVSGLALIWRGVKSMGRGRIVKGGRGVATGVVTIGGALLAALVALNIQTYSRLTWEEPVAELQVASADAAQKLFDVTITEADGAVQSTCRLQGDEWIMGGRVQTWKPWARVVGLDATYQLDQISNKYRDAREANGRQITACDLKRADNKVLAKLPQDFRAWLSSISLAEDRVFGSANYMPLADGASYRVLITQNGFTAEASNAAARDAVDEHMRLSAVAVQ